VFGVRARRRGAAKELAALGALTVFCGAVTIALATLHSLVIFMLRLAAWQKGAGFGWDFRAYSLFLLAGVLITTGVLLVRSAPGLTRRELLAWRGAVAAAVALVAVNAPLAPLQGFAIALGLFALLTLVLLAAAKRWFPAPPR
jgi:hypothetical protein